MRFYGWRAWHVTRGGGRSGAVYNTGTYMTRHRRRQSHVTVSEQMMKECIDRRRRGCALQNFNKRTTTSRGLAGLAARLGTSHESRLTRVTR
jgi:hypothetical protein